MAKLYGDTEILEDKINDNTEQIQNLSSLYVNQVDYVNSLSKIKTYKEMKVKKEDSIVTVELIGNNRGISYTIEKDPNDDFFKLSGGYVGEVGYVDFSKEDVVKTGTFTNQYNSYTVDVGDSFSGTIDGEKILFPFYGDNRGGVWEFTIDGNTDNKIQISTFREVAGDQLSTIGIFEKGIHTVYAEFIGDDPSNAPSGGTARGWLRLNETIESQITGVTKEKILLAETSNKEFALNCAKDNNNNWIPEHNGIPSISNIDNIKFMVDGVENDLSSVVVANENFAIIQKVNGKVAETNVMEIDMLTNFSLNGEVSVIGKMTAISDFIATGYFGMMPVEKINLDTIITSTQDAMNLVGDDENKYFANAKDLTYSAIATGKTYLDGACAVTIDNPYSTLQKGIESRYTDLEKFVFVWDRSNASPKLYQEALMNSQIVTGNIMKFSVRYIVVESKNISKQI